MRANIEKGEEGKQREKRRKRRTCVDNVLGVLGLHLEAAVQALALVLAQARHAGAAREEGVVVARLATL